MTPRTRKLIHTHAAAAINELVMAGFRDGGHSWYALQVARLEAFARELKGKPRRKRA